MRDIESLRLARKSFMYALVFPMLFIALLWLVKLLEIWSGVELVRFGLFPRSLHGIIGIFTSPLIHGDVWHLFSNSVPLAAMGIIMFLFYREIAFPVFFWIYIMTGLWVWAAGREVYHIGASGLAYGFVCFIFFSGIFRWDKRLLRPSIVVLLFYGGMIGGVLPGQPHISWESHALGSLAGIVTAFYFRKDGPQPAKYEWENEEETVVPAEQRYWEINNQQEDPQPQPEQRTTPPQQGNTITYIYVPRSNSNDAPPQS